VAAGLDLGTATGLAVALGCGLLIGLERERRKGEGDDRAAAGIRSFAIAALAGALAQASGTVALVVAGAVLVGALAAIAYARSRSRDPGLTTEIALFATYLVGVQCLRDAVIGAACGAALAVLLAARRPLQRFAREGLSEAELHDGLLLAALALVVLPLVPDEPLAWLGGATLRPLVLLVLLILALQAAGHVALRVGGERVGSALAGFFSGFVSSTATIAALGAKARAAPAAVAHLAGGAVLSTAATWVQVLLIAAALAPGAALALLPAAGAGFGAALACGALLLRHAHRDEAHATASPVADRRPLRPREALLVAALIGGVTLVVAVAQRHFGEAGLYASVALAGLGDAHAPVASLASLYATAQLEPRLLVGGVLLAVTSNSATRLVTAFVAGGAAYGWRVGGALALGLAAAWTAGLLARAAA
jgi:uncharacterized membrane protein (DUF4010 family)